MNNPQPLWTKPSSLRVPLTPTMEAWPRMALLRPGACPAPPYSPTAAPGCSVPSSPGVPLKPCVWDLRPLGQLCLTL